jgi:hypothetical protein
MLARVEVNFDDPNLVANAGLFLVGTLAAGLELEELVNSMVRMVGRVGGALAGRKVLTLVHAIVAGAIPSITPMSCAPVARNRCCRTDPAGRRCSSRSRVW